MKKKNMTTFEFKNKKDLETALVERIKDIILLEIEAFGSAQILLSGGSTPVDLYKELSNVELPWSQVRVALVDERFVTTDDEFSNERLIKETLFQNRAKAASFTGMVYDPMDEKQNLNLVNTMYDQFFSRVTLALLGMGNDGHTASLFPTDDDSLHSLQNQNDEYKVISTRAPQYPIHRISASYSYLMHAENLILMLTGKSKSDLFFQSNRTVLPIDFFKNKLDVYCEV